MIFTPRPENDFHDFIEIYYRECRSRFNKIEAIAGKWNFEDLIPGLSDFDTRFICSNDMTVDDWCNMSTAVGEVHLDLCRRFPKWARILEHLPGVNVTWAELTDSSSFYPEYMQWSFYRCQNTAELERVNGVFSQHIWDQRDEYFFLKKFITFYGPYNRGIDPAINLGSYGNKYPLHSRMMHYFTPPVQAALSIILKKPVLGKFEALRIAREMFPETPIFDEILNTVGKHYETPSLYRDEELNGLEERLFQTLDIVGAKLTEHITIVPEEKKDDLRLWKQSIADFPIAPEYVIFDNSRFSRLMKGRFYFYANAPSHFDNLWLIRNELKRLGDMFYRVPFRIYWHMTHGEKVENPDTIIPLLVPGLLSPQEAEAVLEFSRLLPGSWVEGKEVDIILSVAAIYDLFFNSLSKITNDVKKTIRKQT